MEMTELGAASTRSSFLRSLFREVAALHALVLLRMLTCLSFLLFL